MLQHRVPLGRVAEWTKASVLKTDRELVSLVGSNPPPSAIFSGGVA